MTTKPTVLQQSAPRPRGHNLITIASGKGGVGKTWLAITLSHALAKSGGRVLLFDGDLGLANVDIQIGLMPQSDLGTVIGGKAELKEVITRFEAGKFDIIAGKSGSGTLASLSRARLAALKNDLIELAGRYDKVVLDLGAGLDSSVTMLSENAGIALVTVTDEPTSLTDAYAFIKVALMQNPDTDLRVVINMAENIEDGKRTYGTLLRACENFLKVSPPLVGIIRRDRNVKEAIRQQTAFLIRYPSSDTADDVTAIARALLSPE